ncbi:unnamed protein product [Ectocarpus fasciculatus]
MATSIKRVPARQRTIRRPQHQQEQESTRLQHQREASVCAVQAITTNFTTKNTQHPPNRENMTGAQLLSTIICFQAVRLRDTYTPKTHNTTTRGTPSTWQVD